MRTCPEAGNFEQLTDILAEFPNIGPLMKAPNDEGELGYGGACFPKDVTAFLAELRNFTLLNDVRLKNSRIGETNELWMW